MDNNNQEEAMQEGVNASGKFQHSLAGLKRVPTDGYYEYRTNPNPQTDPWIITGAMKVNRILTKDEVDDLVRKAGREPQRVERDDSDVRFAVKAENIEEINKEFNDNLQKQIDGTLEEGFVYQLGMPSGKILSTGMPYLPIELASYQINQKSTDKKHPFNISALKNLVISLQNPIAIFSYGDSTKAQNIIVEISHNNKNFLIGIHIMPDGLQINSIRGLFPKDTEEWLKWIQDGKSLRLEKEKVQDYIDSFRRINPGNQRVKDLDLDLVAKVIQNFENPPINSEKNSENLQGGDNMVFSVTPEQDAEYMRAVESGDMEKAGAMVKAAFKAKYPNTKVVDENGEPLVVF